MAVATFLLQPADSGNREFTFQQKVYTNQPVGRFQVKAVLIGQDNISTLPTIEFIMADGGSKIIWYMPSISARDTEYATLLTL